MSEGTVHPRMAAFMDIENHLLTLRAEARRAEAEGDPETAADIRAIANNHENQANIRLPRHSIRK
ncbi:hypothetical protein [Roseibium sediminis]|uniref:hypothetical protein n=1 Tax=Roseibium sediminis TaxID=1775174 RepID=UPI00123E32F1|nr:hypothetical protein [Roseibium sediminis]